MPRNARNCTGSSFSPQIWEKGNIRYDSRMAVRLRVTGPSLVNPPSGHKEKPKLTLDFDRLIVTTPSVYSSQSLESDSTCPFVRCDSGNDGNSTGTTINSSSSRQSSSSSETSTAPASTSSPNAAIGVHTGQSVLWLTLGAWVLKRFL